MISPATFYVSQIVQVLPGGQARGLLIGDNVASLGRAKSLQVSEKPTLFERTIKGIRKSDRICANCSTRHSHEKSGS